MFETTENKS